MSEPICICGHEKSEHRLRETGMVEFETHQPYERHMCHCGCGEFRACLDWPDAAGWWWCRSELLDSIAYATAATREMIAGEAITGIATPGEFVVTVAGLHGLTDGHFIRGYFDHEWGPARFVRLQEPNPFTNRGA